MRGRIRSSRDRFAEYRRRREQAGEQESVAERVEGRDKIVAAGKRRSFRALFGAFWENLRGYRRRLVLSLTALTIATLVGLVVPYSTKIVIDFVLTDQPGPSGLPAFVESLGFDRSELAENRGARSGLLAAIGLTILVLSLASAAVGLWGRWNCTRVTKRLQVRLRRRAFQHAVRLPLTRISDLKSGGVASILREDAGNAAELVFSMIYNPFRAVVQLTGTLVVLALVDWRMLLGALVLIPTVWITHRTWIGRIRPVYRDIRRTRQTIDAEAAESFGGIRVVRGFHRGEAEAGRFSRDNHFMARQELMAWWWTRMIEMVWEILIPLVSAAVLLYGGARVLGGHITIGDLMAFTAYVMMLLGPVEALVASAANIQSQLSGLDRTLDLLDEPKEFEDHEAAAEHPPAVITRRETRGEIVFDDVWFRYPRSKPMRARPSTEPDADEREHEEIRAGGEEAGPLSWVLQGVSLLAEPGQTVALVGPSGSGKTTLTNLVARFYDPTLGRVMLDGRDLRDIELDSYRRLLGIVEQDVFLFDGTVAENIAYARRNVSMRQITHAAETANAHGFITQLDEGYDTLIGERGVRLSGGQKQRIAIARAVLADPKILIMDEATSNLDSESERLIQSSLAELMQGRTSFVIAHRLSTIRHADRIMVLEAGRVIETGSHEELLSLDGRYADLLRLQVEGETVG